jgi:hypothetical protein
MQFDRELELELELHSIAPWNQISLISQFI